MLGPLFVFSLLAYVCIGSLSRPHIGIMGYYGFALLQPEWNWRWSLPTDFQYQKYIAASTLIGFLIAGMPGNRFVGPAWRATAAIGVFLGIAYISSLSTIAPSATAFYMDVLWKCVFMAVMTIRLIDTPQKVTALLWVLVLAQGYNAYQINLQYFQDGFSAYATRGFGAKGDNNLYSALTIPIATCSFALAVYSTRKWVKMLAAGIGFLQLHQMMLLESRGSMLGTLLAAAVFLWFMPKTRGTVSAAVASALLTAVLAGPPVVREFMSSFVQDEQLDSSAAGRFSLWEAGYGITKDYPLLGVGPFAGQYLIPTYYPGGMDAELKGVHNLAFEISTGCGVFALLAYLYFYAVPVATSFKLLRQRELPIWLKTVSLSTLSGIVGYWAASMFSSGALLESPYACAAVGIAGAAVWQRQLCLEGDSEF